MNFDITSAAIATMISTTISASVAIWTTRFNKQKNLDDQLDAILKIAIQYPYLESEEFVNSWDSKLCTNDEKFLRYDLYCHLLFNYFERVAKYLNYDKEKIENYFTLKEWVRLHSKYWRDPPNKYENVDGYDKNFVSLINSYITI